MAKRFLGLAMFLRHGQTEYTEVFPDLTETGKNTIAKSANLIMPVVARFSKVKIVTSPKARAQGSAAVIARVIGFDRKEIKEEPKIQSAEIVDRMMGKAIFFEHTSNGGGRALSVAYGIDPRYEDSRIFEPRSKVKERFLEYFAHMIRADLLIAPTPPCLIHTSHYETLYHFVEDIFELDYETDEPLGHGEIIAVAVYDVGIENVVELEAAFRKKIKKANFDYKEKELIV